VCHADILPTLVSAAGGEAPSSADGQDLVKVARGEVEPREKLFAWTGHYSDCDLLAVTDGRWKYIWYPEGASEQLFDLKEDPHELKNLAGKRETADRQTELRQLLTEEMKGRAPVFVVDGELIRKPAQQESETDRRNALIDTWVTDYTKESGVRH
jgi:arylsulfatase A-like enzyme